MMMMMMEKHVDDKFLTNFNKTKNALKNFI